MWRYKKAEVGHKNIRSEGGYSITSVWLTAKVD